MREDTNYELEGQAADRHTHCRGDVPSDILPSPGRGTADRVTRAIPTDGGSVVDFRVAFCKVKVRFDEKIAPKEPQGFSMIDT